MNRLRYLLLSVLFGIASVLYSQNIECLSVSEYTGRHHIDSMFMNREEIDGYYEWLYYKNSSTYIPTLNPAFSLQSQPIKTINLSFHIIQDDEGNGNFPNNGTTIARIQTK